MIEVIKDERVPDFCHKTEYSAGYDLYACIDEECILHPMQKILIPTGIRVNMMNEKNCFAMLVPRSGVSLNTNLRICNSPGTIDMDYNKEICIIIQNIDHDSDIIIKPLMRLAQLIFCNFTNIDIKYVKDFSQQTNRGGFGSTGI